MKENSKLEFKAGVTNTFLKTVSAYANYGGGTILFGVDGTGKVIGLSETKQLCLDIENRPELVQGNIKNDDFMKVWNEGFQAFRRDRTEDCSGCRECTERYVCGGDSTHTWNFETNEPLMCYRDPGQYKH